MVPKMPLSASFQRSGTEDAMVSGWVWVAHGCATEVNVFGACDVVAQRSMGMLSAHRSEGGGGGGCGGVGSGGKQNSSARDRPRLGFPLSAIGFAISAGMTRGAVTYWTSLFLLL